MNKKDSQRRSQLRRIYRDLQHHREHFFKPQTNEVLPAFARTLLRLANSSRAIRELFERTIHHENARYAEMFRDYLVEFRLDEGARARKADFSYAAMREQLQSAPSFNEKLKEIANNFEAYMALFRQPEFQNFDREFTQLERLALLSEHDFSKLLSFFDPEIRLGDPRNQPNFTPAHGRHLTQDLMDFYFLIAELRIEQHVITNTISLYSRLRKEVHEREQLKLKKILETMGSLLEEHLPASIILMLLRATNEDPSLVMSAEKELKTYLELFKSRLLSRFELDREKLIREHSEEAVTHSLQTLFGSTEILPVPAFSEEITRELSAGGFPGFGHVKPLSILKTFVVVQFEQTVKPHCQELLFNAFFEEKTFKEKFVSLFHELQGAIDKIAVFEGSLMDPEEVSILTLKIYLDKHKAGKSIEASLTNLVETINNNTARLVADLANRFAEFNKAFGLLINDSRQHTPLLVSNIRVIGGEQRNAEFLANLAADHEHIELFISIMKHFTIILNSLLRENETGTGPLRPQEAHG